jgi:hypothetical protein
LTALAALLATLLAALPRVLRLLAGLLVLSALLSALTRVLRLLAGLLVLSALLAALVLLAALILIVHVNAPWFFPPTFDNGADAATFLDPSSDASTHFTPAGVLAAPQRHH